jgi:hypothetical protein
MRQPCRDQSISYSNEPIRPLHLLLACRYDTADWMSWKRRRQQLQADDLRVGISRLFFLPASCSHSTIHGDPVYKLQLPLGNLRVPSLPCFLDAGV